MSSIRNISAFVTKFADRTNERKYEERAQAHQVALQDNENRIWQMRQDEKVQADKNAAEQATLDRQNAATVLYDRGVFDKDAEKEAAEAARIAAIRGLVPEATSDEDLLFLSENYTPATLAQLYERGDVYGDGAWTYKRDVESQSANNFILRAIPMQFRDDPVVQELWTQSTIVQDAIYAYENEGISPIDFFGSYRPVIHRDDAGNVIGFGRESIGDSFFKDLDQSDKTRFDNAFYPVFEKIPGIGPWDQNTGFITETGDNPQRARMESFRAAIIDEIQRTPLNQRYVVNHTARGRALQLVTTMGWFSQDNDDFLNETMLLAGDEKVQADEDIIEAINILAGRSMFDNQDYIESEQKRLLDMLDEDQQDRIEGKLRVAQDITPEYNPAPVGTLDPEVGELLREHGTQVQVNAAANEVAHWTNQIGDYKERVQVMKDRIAISKEEGMTPEGMSDMHDSLAHFDAKLAEATEEFNIASEKLAGVE